MYKCTLLIMLRGGGVVLGSRFWPKQIQILNFSWPVLQFGFSVCFVLLDDVTTSSGLKETSKLWRLLVERGAGNRCTDVLPAVLFIKIFQGGLWICGLVQANNQQCHTNLFNLIASVLVAKHCLKSKNEPSNMFYWCLIYKALLWLRLFDFTQLTFPRDIFPSTSSDRVPTRSFEKISANLRLIYKPH